MQPQLCLSSPSSCQPSTVTNCKVFPNISVSPKIAGTKFKPTTENPTLDESKFQTNVVLPPNLPELTVDINQPKLIAFVDASYANDPHKRRSMTGFVFTYCGGAIVYQSKTQSVTARSSIEAEFLAAVCVPRLHSISTFYT